MTPEFAELRRLAEAATPGPWEAATGAVLLADDSDEATHVWYRRWRDDRFLSIGKVLDNELDQTTPEDAEYIAAANPATVLALLDKLDAAEARLATDAAMPMVSGALDEGSALARLLADALNDAIRTLRELAEKAAGEPIPFDDFDLYAEVVDGALNAAAERDALAAKVERVRDWLDHRGVDASDRDGDYMDGYRAAQRHAVIDAAELRAALDEEPQP